LFCWSRFASRPIGDPSLPPLPSLLEKALPPPVFFSTPQMHAAVFPAGGGFPFLLLIPRQGFNSFPAFSRTWKSTLSCARQRRPSYFFPPLLRPGENFFPLSNDWGGGLSNRAHNGRLFFFSFSFPFREKMPFSLSSPQAATRDIPLFSSFSFGSKLMGDLFFFPFFRRANPPSVAKPPLFSPSPYPEFSRSRTPFLLSFGETVTLLTFGKFSPFSFFFWRLNVFFFFPFPKPPPFGA